MIFSARPGPALLVLLIASGITALPSAASAQDADDALPPPRWSAPPQPHADDFPEAALQAGASGAAVIACDAASDGAPVDCEVLSEDPQGMGFGQAALGIVQRGRVASVAGVDGAAAASRRFAVRVPFNLDAEPTQASAQAPINVEARWLTPPRPTASDYPQRAVDRGLSGGAAVRCEVALSGKPTNCAVVAEVPPGSGFGEAAVKIVRRGRLNPATIRPEEVGSAFVVTVPFSIH
ncbi:MULTISPECIES: TonB family protein [Brevundimonas]|uniref:TonB family protein n=1 Tax=Brevundimonas TaxID=41275 RepID=UPI000F76DB98|nr:MULTISPECIES: TonB family protein [Brevundimonas]MBK1975636.1 TonB family protein [Brevundimonas diminuta]RSB42480.1 TonB family protein [Brevundimonas sp. 357]